MATKRPYEAVVIKRDILFFVFYFFFFVFQLLFTMSALINF